MGLTKYAHDMQIDGAIAGGVTTVTADSDYTVTTSDRTILVSTTGAGSRTLTFASGRDGQEVDVIMTAATTGTYTTAGVEGNQVLLDAAQEAARFKYDATGDKWYCLSVEGATRP